MTLTQYVDKNYKFLGIEDTQYIWYGEWYDPEILYKGVLIDSWDIEEGMRVMYEEDIDEGLYPNGYDYGNWVSENKDRVADMLDDMYWDIVDYEEE